MQAHHRRRNRVRSAFTQWVSVFEASDLPPISRTSYFSKKSINPENDGHENKQI